MSNIRKRFEALLPDRRKSLATVNSDRGDGTASVTSPAGNSYVVNTAGVSVSNGDSVVIRGGQIIAKTPATTVYSVSV